LDRFLAVPFKLEEEFALLIYPFHMLVYPLPMQPGFFSYVARSFGHHVNNQSPGAGAFVEENYLVMKDECQKNDDRNRHADKPEKNTATPSRLHLHMK
jgi:hypothetical protein